MHNNKTQVAFRMFHGEPILKVLLDWYTNNGCSILIRHNERCVLILFKKSKTWLLPTSFSKFFFLKADDCLPLFPYLMWRYIQKIQNFFSNFFTLHRKTHIKSNSKVYEKSRKYQTLPTYFQSFNCVCKITSVKNTKT